MTKLNDLDIIFKKIKEKNSTIISSITEKVLKQ